MRHVSTPKLNTMKSRAPPDELQQLFVFLILRVSFATAVETSNPVPTNAAPKVALDELLRRKSRL